jgi:hypothetical protein
LGLGHKNQPGPEPPVLTLPTGYLTTLVLIALNLDLNPWFNYANQIHSQHWFWLSFFQRDLLADQKRWHYVLMQQRLLWQGCHHFKLELLKGLAAAMELLGPLRSVPLLSVIQVFCISQQPEHLYSATPTTWYMPAKPNSHSAGHIMLVVHGTCFLCTWIRLKFLRHRESVI